MNVKIVVAATVTVEGIVIVIIQEIMQEKYVYVFFYLLF
jgi:hypothetical protein